MNHKKLFFLITVIFIIFSPLFATPKGNVYPTEYLGRVPEISAYETYLNLYDATKSGFPVRSWPKLNKNQTELLWKGINQFDYEIGEVYYVMFDDFESDQVPLFCVVAEITGKNKCKAYAFSTP